MSELTKTARDLTILTVTRAEDCIIPLLHRLIDVATALGVECVFVADGKPAFDTLYSDDKINRGSLIANIPSRGYIESILDEAIAHTSPLRRYVFRVDDDESLPGSTVNWLASGAYRLRPHWKFNRAHLWTDEQHYIANLPLWPDPQTRLSTRELSLGRSTIHCGSPHGGGELAPVPIYHHKFLVKSLAQRQEIIARYNGIYPGSGSNFLAFSLPETYYADKNESITLCPVHELN